MKILVKQILIAILLLSNAGYVLAADSYRYMHVSIDTPWAIFVFLLFIVLFPFVLSAILYWYFTFKKQKDEEQSSQNTKTSAEEKNG